jgi:hypothetical protein
MMRIVTLFLGMGLAIACPGKMVAADTVTALW